MSNKLHEVLAVEGDLQGVAKKIIEEAINTFSKKPDHFKGHVKTYKPFEEGDEHQMPGEISEIVTTVNKKLEYAFKPIAKYYDAVLQKEATNQVAKGDIVVDGVTIATDVPATFLLGLESKLKEVRSIVLNIPTIAPGVAWERDEVSGDGIYRAKHPIETIRTVKDLDPVVLYEATKEHPAQVKILEVNRIVGKYVTEVTCSMFTPTEKSNMLARVDSLISAVKQARQRANNVDVIKSTIGQKIFDFIVG